MVRVITYGTFDLLHFGHIKLLEHAKALGDYLIVGITADDFDRNRGKINVQQILMERIEAVRSTGLADEIVIEEYEGQKIDDIHRFNIDIFAIGSDWKGKFDYLKEYCKVVYLERTQGISSSDIRSHDQDILLGVVGKGSVINKFMKECQFVNGVHVLDNWSDYSEMIEQVDAVYLYSHPSLHYDQAKYALEHHKNVLCEMPVTLSLAQTKELYELADKNNCILYPGCKTAFSTAYGRMLLLAKGGKIGKVVSVDAVCTSLRPVDGSNGSLNDEIWSSLYDWGPIALLPVFQLLGTDFTHKDIISRILDDKYDEFTECRFIYPSACASIKVGNGVKSEGDLVISGTKGYIYVPAPWWKTDYFEIRYENVQNNKRYFYQLDGEGVRYEISSFVRSIHGLSITPITKKISEAVVQLMEDYNHHVDVIKLQY